MNAKPNNENLLTLVDLARKGKIVLPQFQRNFVWNATNITDLLISILEGYFIGTFLMLDADAENVPFAARAIQGVDIPEDHLQPEWMILDGQQRLTSLNYVFSAPPIPMRWTKYPYRFFLDLTKLAEGDVEGAIWSERADYCGSWLERDKQFETLQIPFTELADWDEWRYAYESWLWEQGQNRFAEYRQHYQPAWHQVMKQFQSFEVPVIEIPKVAPDDDEAIGRVCAIFEKMNSTGVKLSVYDLLTARMYRSRIDMHYLWQQAVEQHSLLAEYSGGDPNGYGVTVLRTISLMRGQDVKSKTLINLKPEGFESDWEAACYYIEQALKRITSTNPDGFGVFDQKWLPYSTMIAPMAAMLAYIEQHRLEHNAYKWLRRWYWSAVFQERFSTTIETRMYRDYHDLVDAAREDGVPEAVLDAQAGIVDNLNYSLREVSRVNAVYSGIMCLVAKAGAKDFRADDSIEFHTLDDHHIFPQAYLKGQQRPDGKKYEAGDINTIVNRTLIASTTNRSISRSAPSQYIARLVPPERLREIMASHFIDDGAVEAMRQDDYEQFLAYREQALLAEVRRQIAGE